MDKALHEVSHIIIIILVIIITLIIIIIIIVIIFIIGPHNNIHYIYTGLFL